MAKQQKELKEVNKKSPDENSKNNQSTDSTNTFSKRLKSSRRGIYLLPNLFTIGALFSGFYGILAAVNGLFEKAVIAIFIAMILDGLDGRVARLTHTQTAFGAEFDSLSDVVAFGVAPAIVAYSLILADLGKFGWMAAFIYLAGGVLRLARFNVQLTVADKRYFVGLPIPAAAALVISMAWEVVDKGFARHSAWLAIIVAIIVAGVGLLMVSNIKYQSFKEFDFKGKVPFISILLLVFVFIIIFLDPPRVLFLTFLAYVLSGPALFIWRFYQKKRRARKFAKPAD